MTLPNAVTNKNSFLPLHLAFLSVSAIVAWCLQYFEADQGLVSRLSFRVVDPSWVPPGFVSTPIIGAHYFGDFQIYYAYGWSANPYFLEVPPSFLPTGDILLSLLSFLPYTVAFCVYVILSVLALLAGAWKIATISQKIDFWSFLQGFLVFVALSLPVIVDLDRGNLHSIALGLTAIYFANGMKGKHKFNFLWLLVAASLKPYLIIFIFAFVTKSTVKKVVSQLMFFAIANLIAMQLITGNLILGIKGLLMGLVAYTGTVGPFAELGLGQIAHSGSLAGSIHRILEFFTGTETSLSLLRQATPILPLLSVILAIIGFKIWYSKDLKTWQRLLGAFSIVSLAQSGSMAYGWVWAGFVAIAFLFSGEQEGQIHTKAQKLDKLFIQFFSFLALVPTWVIVPSPGMAQRPISNYLVLSPILLAYLLWILFYRAKVNSSRLR